MRKSPYIFVLLISLFLTLSLFAIAAEENLADEASPGVGIANLYRVEINSHDQAVKLRAAGIDPVLALQDGYLVLADEISEIRLFESGLEYELVASSVSRENLALDIRFDDMNAGRFPLIFEDNGVRVFNVDPSAVESIEGYLGLAPLKNRRPPILFKEPLQPAGITRAHTVGLDSLIRLVRQDTLQSYVETLQSYPPRVAGSAANAASRDWIYGKLVGYGYDSVRVDTFLADTYSGMITSYNVVAVKTGSEFPDHQIIIGAHRDAVSGSPGADDNGSGTAAVMEFARILSDIETNMTIIFVLFDTEEFGLFGSWYYADNAVLNGDNIVFMLNMDMIAYYLNFSEAYLYHGDDDAFAQLWIDLADSLSGINITGYKAGTSAQSDHYPFQQNGYDCVFAFEYIFSDVYHSYQDSTTYMDFNYYRRMAQACVATAFAVDELYAPGPALAISFPQGTPEMVPPGTAATVEVEVTGLYGGSPVPGSGYLYYSVDGAPYGATPLTEQGGDMYEATFPAFSCNSKIAYYIAMDEASSGTYYYPSPDNPLSVPVATGVEAAFEDDFNTNLGWTVTGNALDGQWSRGIPVGGGDRGDPPTDYDGSGYCYLTDNVDDNSDVDGGTTTLISPTINLGGDMNLVHYARWYSNHFGAAPFADEMHVYVSGNNGAAWTLVETVGPVEQASGGWYVHEFWVEDFLTSADSIKVRFDASDLGEGSVVEAAVDEFFVKSFVCQSDEPIIITQSLPDWTAGLLYDQQLLADGGNGTLTWSDKYGDLIGTGLTLSGTGHLGGTPVAAGDITFTALVVDEDTDSDERLFTFTINPVLEITTASLPEGIEGEVYSCQLTSEGGTGDKTWTDKNGDLEGSGLTLSAGGLLSGTPAIHGTVEFTVSVTDEVGADDEAPLTLVLGAPYLCGDLNDDDAVDILDIIMLINFKYKSGPAPEPLESADVNGDGEVNLLDIVYLIQYKYKDGLAPNCP